jgi:hypothetical protein
MHSWQAHGGKKIKALALCPTGRLFTGAAALMDHITHSQLLLHCGMLECIMKS